MDIEGFYDADPRRRHSEEVSLGRDWTDAVGTRWECNWVVDTGEVYLMQEPTEPVEMDPLGDTWVPDMPMDVITVEVLSTIGERALLDRAVDGWSDAMAAPNSIEWIRGRVTQAAVGGPDGS